MEKREYSHIATFSLPADIVSSTILSRFIRDMARPAGMLPERIDRLRSDAVAAFEQTVIERANTGEGRVALKIKVTNDNIVVDIKYRETHFPPEEVFCLS